MAATVRKKTASDNTSMQLNVFEGISAVFAVKDGFTFNNSGSLDLNSADARLLEFPCSEDSGFSFDTGAPSIEHFKVHGLNADWVSTFTPGDTELNIEIPCHDTEIMQLVFGSEGTNISIDLPLDALKDTTGVTAATATGKGFGAAQKSVELGLLILDDTEKRLFYVKKAKLTAQVTFDGSNKPLCVVLSGSLSDSGDGAFGILNIATTSGN